MLESIGPLWDGNEVWLVIAGGASSRPSPSGTRRCSPASTWVLLSILALLIVRVLSFEWRGKAESARWSPSGRG